MTLPQSFALPEGLSKIETDAGSDVKMQQCTCSSTWAAGRSGEAELNAAKTSCSLRDSREPALAAT